MSVSRREVRRLRSAGWEVLPVTPGAWVRRALWQLITGRKSAPVVAVVPARRRSSR